MPAPVPNVRSAVPTRFALSFLSYALVFGLAFLSLRCSYDGIWTPAQSTWTGLRSYQDGETAKRTLEGKVPAGVGRIEIVNRFGEVTVEGGVEAPEWRWEVTVSAPTKELAEAALAEIETRNDVKAGRARWELVLPETSRDHPLGIESKVRVLAPPTVEVAAENHFGKTVVHHIEGGTQVQCSHGEVEVNDLGGRVDVETSFARLTARRIPAATLASQHGFLEATEVRGDLTARTSFAGLQLTGIEGSVTVENQHGEVQVRDVKGDARIRTSFASLLLENSGGSAHLRNQHGRITARGVREEIDVESSFAPIALDTEGAIVRCFNQHGSVDLTLRSPEVRSVEAVTSFADLSIAVPANLAPGIAADTSFGEVHSSLPIYPGKQIEKTSLPAEAPQIRLRNTHGDIRIERGAASSVQRH